MRKYFSILFLVPLLSACEKDIKVKLPDHEEQLFFYSDVETGRNFTAYVRRSEKINNYNNLHDLSIKNAVVMLYINNEDGRPVYYVDSLERYYSPVILKLEDKVRVVVTAPNYPDASATASMPSDVPIETIMLLKGVRIDQYGNPASEIKIKFTDPTTAGDYYMIDIITAADRYVENDSFVNDWICIKSTDPSIDELTSNDPLSEDENSCLPSKGLLLNDQLFNGQTKELTLSMSDYYLDPITDSASGITYYPQIKLKHISSAYYQYIKTTKNVLDNSGNPFAEPVNVKSNIKNGYGVLAPTSISIKEIKNP